MNFIGRPPINRVLFAVGKLALAGCLGATVMRAFFPVIALYRHGVVVSLLILALFAVGSLIVFAALVNLGASTRMGLPLEATVFKTHGLYRISRNPMYLGLHLTCLAATLWVAHPVVLVLFVVSVVVHHRIILAEERFLERSFADAWRAYASRVRRYL